MAHANWCGKDCSECHGCNLDESIPCSPACKNLIGNMINIKGCLEAKCEEVFYIFDMEDLLIEMGAVWDDKNGKYLLDKYGEIAQYPY